MQALGVEQYARLQRLARGYQHRHAQAIKRSSERNPRLGVDALCFQPLPGQHRDGDVGEELVGALITPLSLSLAIVPPPGEAMPAEGQRRLVSLPGGRYPFHAEPIDDETWLWRCPLLDDLSDLDSLQDANRLAQHLLERVMTPAVDNTQEP
ncbi:[NiFe]-hydrogenase assembly chaperone HybE [Litchfieldella rifensis]|uniref:[NiFe]-hydrogenase assembly chaperone HybE n=1 Tax=Litchfieldella rifensis TaxID=762643 RepID=A0ABV7LS78_9GAMM